MAAADVQKQVALWETGFRVTVATSFGEEVSGEVLAHDTTSGLLTLKQPGSTPFHSNLRVLRTEHITTVLSAAPGQGGQLGGRLPYIDPQRCKGRESRAVLAAEFEAAKVGVDVSPQAQAIFNGLAKTMPCQWRGTTIVVLDEVSIVPPYDAGSCSQLAPNAKLFDRVQKVLSAERGKLGLP